MLVYKCVACNKKWRTLQGIQNHVNKNHGKSKVIKGIDYVCLSVELKDKSTNQIVQSSNITTKKFQPPTRQDDQSSLNNLELQQSYKPISQLSAESNKTTAECDIALIKKEFCEHSFTETNSTALKEICNNIVKKLPLMKDDSKVINNNTNKVKQDPIEVKKLPLKKEVDSKIKNNNAKKVKQDPTEVDNSQIKNAKAKKIKQDPEKIKQPKFHYFEGYSKGSINVPGLLSVIKNSSAEANMNVKNTVEQQMTVSQLPPKSKTTPVTVAKSKGETISRDSSSENIKEIQSKALHGVKTVPHMEANFTVENIGKTIGVTCTSQNQRIEPLSKITATHSRPLKQITATHSRPLKQITATHSRPLKQITATHSRPLKQITATHSRPPSQAATEITATHSRPMEASRNRDVGAKSQHVQPLRDIAVVDVPKHGSIGGEKYVVRPDDRNDDVVMLPRPVHHQKEKRKLEYSSIEPKDYSESTSPEPCSSSKRVCLQQLGPELPILRKEVSPSPLRDIQTFGQKRSNLTKLLDFLLPELEKEDVNNFFQLPVSDAFAPGYSRIIQNPMDFSTIRLKIDEGRYETLSKFRADFCLICTNCTLYNMPDTVYHKAAEELLQQGQRILSPERLRLLAEHNPIMHQLDPTELGFQLREEHVPAEFTVEDEHKHEDELLHLDAESVHANGNVENVIIPDKSNSHTDLRPKKSMKRKKNRTGCGDDDCVPCSVKVNCNQCHFCLNRRTLKQKCFKRMCPKMNSRLEKLKIAHSEIIENLPLNTEPTSSHAEVSDSNEVIEDDLNVRDNEDKTLIIKELLDDIVESISTHPKVLKSKCKPPTPKPKIFRCVKCGKSYSQFKSMQSHEKECKIDRPKKLYICDQCKKNFSSDFALKRHLKIHTKAQKMPPNLQCNDCQIKFSAPNKLKSHMKQKHGIDDNNKSKEVIRCQVEGCTFEHTQMRFVKSHMTRVHGLKEKIKCNLCPFECYSRKGLYDHLRCVHTVLTKVYNDEQNDDDKDLEDLNYDESNSESDNEDLDSLMPKEIIDHMDSVMKTIDPEIVEEITREIAFDSF